MFKVNIKNSRKYFAPFPRVLIAESKQVIVS